MEEMYHIEINAPPICEYCKKPHDGSYGSGRFCSRSCAASYSSSRHTPESRAKAAESNKKHYIERTPDNELLGVKNGENYNIPKSVISDCVHKNKKSIGLAGEVATIKKFVDRGIDVYIPLGDNSRADLAADFNGKLQKIQVKTSTTTDNTRTIFAVSQSSFNVVDGKIKLKRKNYTPDEVDYLALYDQHADRLFLVDSHKLNKRAMNIRYTIPKNNNPNVNYADDYDFDKVLDEIEFKNQSIIDAENFEVIDDE